MPTYTYECVSCGHAFDVFHPMSATPKIRCEECDSKCERLIGKGAGLIFKGSGFYETDYKDKKGAAAASGKNGDGAEKSAENKGETKSEKKTESTPEKKTERTSEKKTEGKSDVTNPSKPTTPSKE